MKNKIVSRLKKMKKKENMSYLDVSMRLGYASATTAHNFIVRKAIPKSKLYDLDNKLKGLGY